MSEVVGEIRGLEVAQLLALADELRRAGVSPDARVRLTLAEPGWLFAAVDDPDRQILALAVDEAAEVHRGAVVVPARLLAPRL